MLVLAPLALRHAGTWRARVAVPRGKQAMTKLRTCGNAWRGGDTWRTANPASPGPLFRAAGAGGPNGEPLTSTVHREERRRCSISVSWVRAVTRGWASASRAQKHWRFTQKLCRARPGTPLRHIYITMAFSGTSRVKDQGLQVGTCICVWALTCHRPTVADLRT